MNMPPDLTTRYFDPLHGEHMDAPDVDRAALARDLANLRIINRYFGGHDAARFAASRLRTGSNVSILDCACGSGDLSVLQSQILRPSRAVAVDLHPLTLAEARSRHSHLPIEWLQADLRALPFADNTFDLVSCHLALHHFAHEDAVQVLRELARVCSGTVVVSDLTRSRFGYLGVWLLVKLWLRDPMTQHDGLLSVRRAFVRNELLELGRSAGWTAPRYRRLPWSRQALWWQKQ